MMPLHQQRQDWNRWGVSLSGAAILMGFWVTTSYAQIHPWEKLVVEICVPMGVPKVLAFAVIDIESKGNPLAVNMARNGSHEGFLPQDPTRAQALLKEALSQTPTVGVGLLQITYAFHRAVMTPNPHRFFDPATNLAYGCGYLAKLLAQPGPLWKRIGRYHSASNLGNQQQYAKRVLGRMMRYLSHPNGGRRK